MNQWSWNITQNIKKKNTSFHSKYYILKMPSITLLTLGKPISFNSFNTTTFLLNSWASLFKVVYPRLYGMGWRHFTVSMNPGRQRSYRCSYKMILRRKHAVHSPWLHFKLKAIHGHATRQHHSPSPHTLKIEKHRCQIARFTGGPCILVWEFCWIVSDATHFRFHIFVWTKVK